MIPFHDFLSHVSRSTSLRTESHPCVCGITKPQPSKPAKQKHPVVCEVFILRKSANTPCIYHTLYRRTEQAQSISNPCVLSSSRDDYCVDQTIEKKSTQTHGTPPEVSHLLPFPFFLLLLLLLLDNARRLRARPWELGSQGFRTMLQRGLPLSVMLATSEEVLGGVSEASAKPGVQCWRLQSCSTHIRTSSKAAPSLSVQTVVCYTANVSCRTADWGSGRPTTRALTHGYARPNGAVELIWASAG